MSQTPHRCEHGHAHHDHGHHEDAHHGHHGHHHHTPTDFGRAFRIGIALNLVFVAIEMSAGIFADSVALMADATHNLADVLALALAWGAAVLSRRVPTHRYTYGLKGTSILAALANAVLLLLITGGLAWEALQRLTHPPGVQAGLVIAIAALGVLINGATALLFMGGGKQDLNIRGAYLHMATDAAISLGVVVAGAGMLAFGWNWLDPLVTLVLVTIIAAGTWSMLRDSVSLALQAVPSHIDPQAVRNFLASQDGVTEVHDMHIWGMSTSENALTTHLICPGGHPGDDFLHQLSEQVEARYGIHHATFQVELGNGDVSCPLAPDHVV